MFQKILVPLDGSKVGEDALPYVEELVSKLPPQPKVEVTLFQAISALTHWVVAGEASARVAYNEKELELIKKEALRYLDTAAEALRKKGAIINTKVSIGPAADEINKTAAEVKADLIAMSTHGRSGLSRLAFGSVTDKVLRGGKLPVLLVRAPKEVPST